MITSFIFWCAAALVCFICLGRWKRWIEGLTLFGAQLLWLGYSVLLFQSAPSGGESDVEGLNLFAQGCYIVVSAIGWDVGRYWREEVTG